MYCSSCGVAVAQGLSYCNYCGVKLRREKDDDQVKPVTLVRGMVTLFVFGLMAIIFLMMAMKMIGLNEGQILGFISLSFLIMLTVEGVLIRLLLRRKRGTEEPRESTVLKGQTTKELDSAPVRWLPEAMPSVTEQTTSTLEPVYSERRSK